MVLVFLKRSTMNKLIYFTFGNNQKYLEIAQLCINSLIVNNYDGDI